MSGQFGLPYRRPGAVTWASSYQPMPVAAAAPPTTNGVLSYYAQPETTQIQLPVAAGSVYADLSQWITRNVDFHEGGCPACTISGNENINDSNWHCNTWPLFFATAAGTGVRLVDADKTFAAASGTIQYVNNCGFDYGFNVVQGARNWAGTFPFSNASGSALLCDGTTQTKKYLQMEIVYAATSAMSMEHKRTRDSDGAVIFDVFTSNSGSESYTGIFAVNALSQELSKSVSKSLTGFVFTDQSGNPITFSNWLVGGETGPFNPFSAIYNTWIAACDGITFDGYSGSGSGAGASIAAALVAAFSATNTFYGNLSATVEIVGDYKFHVLCTYTPTVTTIHLTEGGVAYTEVYTGTNTGASDGSFEFTVTLSNPNNLYDVDNDCANLLGNWAFNNKSHFPEWRKDSAGNLAVWVGRNEVQTNADPKSVVSLTDQMDDYRSGTPGGPWAQTTWKDPACWSWVFAYGYTQATALATSLFQVRDGSIIGTPLALGKGVATAAHTTRGICSTTNGLYATAVCLGSDAYVSWGSITPSVLPAHCAKWTHDGDSGLIYPCAFVSHEGIGGYAVYMQKWAETLVPTPSYDWMRPYGTDRNLPKWSTADCSTGVMVTSPRYPTCPPFGVCVISSATYDAVANKTTFTFTPAAVWNTDTSWSIDIFVGTVNPSGVLVPEATPAASSITLNSDGTLAGNYSTAKFFCPHGLAPWTCDTGRKGNYVTRTAATAWDGTVTDSGTVQRIIKPRPDCCIVAVGYSPNGDTATGWQLDDFPRDGSGNISAQKLWRGCVTQWMVDPLYDPGKYCGGGGDMTVMNNIICPTATPDDTCTISICDVPFVEAMKGPPSDGGWASNQSAPALPSDAENISNIGAMPSAGTPTSPLPWDIYSMCNG